MVCKHLNWFSLGLSREWLLVRKTGSESNRKQSRRSPEASTRVGQFEQVLGVEMQEEARTHGELGLTRPSRSCWIGSAVALPMARCAWGVCVADATDPFETLSTRFERSPVVLHA